MQVVREGQQPDDNDNMGCEEEENKAESEEESDPEDGDQGLHQYCEPEHNAVQELEAETKEQLNLQEYLKFKQQLEAEELFARQQQELFQQQQQALFMQQ